MKNLFILLITLMAVSPVCYCQKRSKAKAKVTANASKSDAFTSTLRKLATGFQKNGLFAVATTEFIKLYTQATDAPTNTPGSLGGDDELLYNLLGGQDPDDNGKFKSFTVLSKNNDTARIKTIFMNFGYPEEHIFVVKNIGGQWKIDDWDDAKQNSINYIKIINEELAGEKGPQTILDRMEITDPGARKEYIDECNTYKQKYGIK